MIVDILFGVALIANVYVLVYLRLMVRFHQQKQGLKTMGNGATLMTIPPYGKLLGDGRSYARKWWYALGVLSLLIAALTLRIF